MAKIVIRLKCKKCGRLYVNNSPIQCKCGSVMTVANTELVFCQKNIFGRVKEIKEGEQNG